MSIVVSWVVGRGCLLWPVCLDRILLAFALLHFVLKAKLACYSWYRLTSCFWIPVPYDEKDIFFFFFLVLVPEGLVGLHKMKWGEMKVCESCLTLCDPMDCSPPGSSIHGLLQERILEWVAISFSRGSSWRRDQTHFYCIVGRLFTIWTTREDCRSP